MPTDMRRGNCRCAICSVSTAHIWLQTIEGDKSAFLRKNGVLVEARNGCLCYELIDELSECSIF